MAFWHGLSGPVMGKGARESGPPVDLAEQVGDADARDQSVEPGRQTAMLQDAVTPDRREGQAAGVDHGVRQAVRLRRRGECRELRIQRGCALLAPGLEAVGDGEAKSPFGPHGLEGRPRQQVVLEGAVSPASLDPWPAPIRRSVANLMHCRAECDGWRSR